MKFQGTVKHKVCGIDFTLGVVEIEDETVIHDLINNDEFGHSIFAVEEKQKKKEKNPDEPIISEEIVYTTPTPEPENTPKPPKPPFVPVTFYSTEIQKSWGVDFVDGKGVAKDEKTANNIRHTKAYGDGIITEEKK